MNRTKIAILATTVLFISCNSSITISTRSQQPTSEKNSENLQQKSDPSDAVYSKEELESMGWEVFPKLNLATKPYVAEEVPGEFSLASYGKSAAKPKDCGEIFTLLNEKFKYSCNFSCQDFSHKAIKECMARGITALRFSYFCVNDQIPKDCPGYENGHAIILVLMEDGKGEQWWCPQEPQGSMPKGVTSNISDNVCVPANNPTYTKAKLDRICEATGLGNVMTETLVWEYGVNPPGNLSDPTKTCTENFKSYYAESHGGEGLFSCNACCGEVWGSDEPPPPHCPVEENRNPVKGRDEWKKSCKESCSEKYGPMPTFTPTPTPTPEPEQPEDPDDPEVKWVMSNAGMSCGHACKALKLSDVTCRYFPAYPTTKEQLDLCAEKARLLAPASGGEVIQDGLGPMYSRCYVNNQNELHWSWNGYCSEDVSVPGGQRVCACQNPPPMP